MLVGDLTVSGLDPKKIFFLKSSCTVVGAGTVGKAQAGPGRAGEIYPAQNVIRYLWTQATGTHFRLLSLVC